MQSVPKPAILSIIIDAGCVHKVADKILDVVRRYPPPATIGGSYILRGVVRQTAFWLPIIAAVPRLVRLAGIPSGVPVGIRTFVFDALYSPGATGLAATTGERRLGDTDRLAREAAERSFVYWFGPTPLFSDPKAAAGKGPSLAITNGTLHTPDGNVDYAFSVPLSDGLTHGGAAQYDRPGLYLGYLSAADRGGVNQKEVDTMMALCMLLEAQKGHSVVFYGQDTDLVPAVQLASQYKPAIVCSLEDIPQRWRTMQSYARDLLTEQLPVMFPAFRSWSDAEREQACADVAEALRIPRNRVKTIDADLPTIVDAEFLRLLHAYEPARVRVEVGTPPQAGGDKNTHPREGSVLVFFSLVRQLLDINVLEPRVGVLIVIFVAVLIALVVIPVFVLARILRFELRDRLDLQLDHRLFKLGPLMLHIPRPVTLGLGIQVRFLRINADTTILEALRIVHVLWVPITGTSELTRHRKHLRASRHPFSFLVPSPWPLAMGRPGDPTSRARVPRFGPTPMSTAPAPDPKRLPTVHAVPVLFELLHCFRQRCGRTTASCH